MVAIQTDPRAQTDTYIPEMECEVPERHRNGMKLDADDNGEISEAGMIFRLSVRNVGHHKHSRNKCEDPYFHCLVFGSKICGDCGDLRNGPGLYAELYDLCRRNVVMPG